MTSEERAKEIKESLIAMCEGYSARSGLAFDIPEKDSLIPFFLRHLNEVVKEEREACAKTAAEYPPLEGELYYDDDYRKYVSGIAKAIRGRK